jgi:bifunctional enzyme CysN/CysC
LTAFSGETTQELLRFLTAGSVDDGKSTLIGRLLHDSGKVYEDEMASLFRITSGNGHNSHNGRKDQKFDPSLLTDGLKAEREQGITIDVAYRYFSTARRRFIIADTPGHDQYTRNMATGASTADAAILLIDSRRGILPQTRRHAYIAWLLGIKSIIVAMNKMDLVGFDRAVFEQILSQFNGLTAKLPLQHVHFIPISAFHGDNVLHPSERTPWYKGQTLLEILESIPIHDDRISAPFRYPIQAVIRAKQEFRGYAGQIASGEVSPGEEVMVLPSRTRATVAQVINHKQELRQAFVPMSVVISLKQQIDLGRGDMLCDPQAPPSVVRRLRAKLIWMSSDPLRPGEPYLLKHTTQTACMIVLQLLHKIDIGSLEEVPADSLELNEIGEVEIEVHKPIFCDLYSDNRTTGSFIVVHPLHNTTVAAGMISQLPEAGTEGDALARSAASSGAVRGLAVWFTGLSGAGKTTICEGVNTELLARGIRAEILDGDTVRKSLSRELGFSRSERDENIRRIGFVAELLARNGVVVLVSAISPCREVRKEVRNKIGNFMEVFVNAPLEICEQRDPKGLYKKARAGDIVQFTGIDGFYDPPLSPEVECKTDRETIKDSIGKVVEAILRALQHETSA